MNLHAEIEQQLPGHPHYIKINKNLALIFDLENIDPDLF